jgi:phage terminase large subunit
LSVVTSRSSRSPWLVAADLFDPKPDPYAADPVGFARDVLGFKSWSKQAEILEAVRDHPRVAVRSSHGPGKTATAAQIVPWFLKTHPNSRVITTAPTWQQVEQLLWREIRSSVTKANALAVEQIFPQASAAKLELGEQWFALGLSTNEPERFQGHHAPFILLVVDEASGVDERIFQAAEGFLTAEGAHVLLLGNPTKLGGQFHRAFTVERATWHTIHISTFDTPNYTGEPVPPEVARSLPRKGWAEEKARAWGVKSPMYQVRVLGNFPSQASNAVVPLHQVEEAQARESIAPWPALLSDVTVTCDVARFGDDETVIATRHGAQIRIREHYHGRDLMQTVGHVIRAWKMLAEEAGAHPRIVIDDTGVGGGVTDRLRELGYTVTPFNGGNRSYTGDYPNRRSEAWFAFAEALPGLDLDGDDQLAADLTSPTYKLDSQGRRVVEPKGETKKRLGRSPDRADAALMTLVSPTPVSMPGLEAMGPPVPPAGLGDWEAGAPRSASITGDLLDDDM